MIYKEGKEKSFRRAMRLSDALYHIGIDVRRKIFHKVLDSFGGVLSFIICGGAALNVEYVKEFRIFGIEILNGYGTTECSPVAAVNRNRYGRDGSVGLALPGSAVKAAEDGEVLISGSHVMLGYYKDEEATKEVLKHGWYASGDLGYLDQDGFLFLQGRKKNLIVLSNGENVSSEMLEEKLYRVEGVQDALVYEKDGKITAEVYVDLKLLPDREAVYQEIDKINKTLKPHEHIGALVLRSEPFEKTATQKIKRY